MISKTRKKRTENPSGTDNESDKRDRCLFALKIAIFNTGLFLFKCITYNLYDGGLTKSINGPRSFWMGHWVYLFALPLFFGIYCTLSRAKGSFWRYWFPGIYTFGFGVFLALFNFNHPEPSGGFIYYMFHASLIGMLATWIRYTNGREEIIEEKSISEEIRLLQNE